MYTCKYICTSALQRLLTIPIIEAAPPRPNLPPDNCLSLLNVALSPFPFRVLDSGALMQSSFLALCIVCRHNFTLYAPYCCCNACIYSLFLAQLVFALALNLTSSISTRMLLTAINPISRRCSVLCLCHWPHCCCKTNVDACCRE